MGYGLIILERMIRPYLFAVVADTSKQRLESLKALFLLLDSFLAMNRRSLFCLVPVRIHPQVDET